jgi:phosphoribosylamine--glycine ligase
MTMTFSIPQQPKVLVVGNGAREHAIAWALRQSSHDVTLYAAPGNAGIADIAACVNIAVDDVEGLVEFAEKEAVDLVVVGPELPLARGLADRCFEKGIRVFGPELAAARLESSKAFAKSVMAAAGVPTASYQTFTDAESAKAYVHQCGAPIVVKADGLAAGKGVVVADTVEEACAAIDEMMVGAKFGASGTTVVIEQCLRGEEVSMMFFVDAHTAVPMIPARDHKRVGEGDTGANTGGMGAFAPVPGFVESGMVEVVQQRIISPLLNELKSRGIQYRGVLYAGLMMTEDGPFVIEFNCRFGDPETEVVLPLLDSDLLEILWAVTDDSLADVSIRWKPQKAICVVLASPGYPEQPRTGGEIQTGDATAGLIFHAGTRRVQGTLLTAGGRVIVCCGVADSFATARDIAYADADAIYFEGKHFRRDIAGSLK